MKLHDLSSCVPITYKKLSRIRFKCGRISHGTNKAASTVEEDQDARDQYGTWLRAGQLCTVKRRTF